MKKILIKLLVFLLVFTSFSLSTPTSKVEASSAVIDSYITVNSVTKNSSGTITVRYSVKKAIPTAVNICIGYNWPSSYRLSASNNYCSATSKSVGSYIKTIPKPTINIIGTQNVVAKITGRYLETKSLGSVFNYPSTRSKVNHTVTTADAVAEYMIVGGLGVGLKYMKNNSIGILTKAAYLGFTTYYGFTGIGVISGFPPRVKGQYYEVETWYNSNGLNVKTTIWSSKTASSRGDLPIYSGTRVTRW